MLKPYTEYVKRISAMQDTFTDDRVGAVGDEDDATFDAAAFERAAEDLRKLWLQRPRRGLARELDAAAPLQDHDECGDAEAQQPSIWWPAVSGCILEGRAELGPEADNEPAVPVGYRRVSEAEQEETLRGLQEKLAELEARYARLPLRIETEGQRRQQKALRAKIKETEEAMQLFSRPGGVLMEI